MSGTGKSSALAELARRGFEVVDTDRGGWSVWSNAAGGYVWDEERIEALLVREEDSTLYVSATVSNQGRFYSRFDAVVLLSAPAEVLISRITTRETNDYGKSSQERDLIVRHLAEVEPLLRATCTHEVDATQSLDADEEMQSTFQREVGTRRLPSFSSAAIVPAGSTRAVTRGRTSSSGRMPTTSRSWAESAVTKSVSSR